MFCDYFLFTRGRGFEGSTYVLWLKNTYGKNGIKMAEATKIFCVIPSKLQLVKLRVFVINQLVFDSG